MSSGAVQEQNAADGAARQLFIYYVLPRALAAVLRVCPGPVPKPTRNLKSNPPETNPLPLQLKIPHLILKTPQCGILLYIGSISYQGGVGPLTLKPNNNLYIPP